MRGDRGRNNTDRHGNQGWNMLSRQTSKYQLILGREWRPERFVTDFTHNTNEIGKTSPFFTDFSPGLAGTLVTRQVLGAFPAGALCSRFRGGWLRIGIDPVLAANLFCLFGGGSRPRGRIQAGGKACPIRRQSMRCR